ncbi:hypothetical protein CK247_24205, partial [Klebsiella pneumoniae]
MQIGFIGLGAVVETAYLPALRRLGDVIDRCQGYDLDCSREQSGSKVDLLCRLVLSASARWWKPPIYRRCVA